MESLVPVAEKLWNAWELRLLVLTSLLLQIILIFMGKLRMYGWGWSLVNWCAYIAADYIATSALGVLSGSISASGGRGDGSPSSDQLGRHNGTMELVAFWSPFLLLHLGGPDTITAFALEDNELWKRHLVGLVNQVALALYVIIKSIIMKSLGSNQLLAPTVLMFAVGVLKFGERTWTLRYGSQDKFRESMEGKPDPGPNYVKFMEEYACKKEAGLHANIKVEKEPDLAEEVGSIEDEGNNISSTSNESEILREAHNLYQTFRRLIVDQILSFHDRNKSKSIFMKLDAKQAFKVIEVELSFIYEDLYTKAPLVYTVPGVCFRALALIFIFVSLLLFQIITDKSRYSEIDIIITYVLLVGGLALELYANALHICSDRSFLWLKKRMNDNNTIIKRMSSSRKEKKYWSHSMAQYNLLDECLYKPRCMEKMIQWIDEMKELSKTTVVKVPEGLEKFILDELQRKSNDVEDLMKEKKKGSSSSSAGNKERELDLSRDYKRLGDCRGEQVLQDWGYLKDLGWSVVDVEFDESILIWHIATEICYTQDCAAMQLPEGGGEISKALSDYMLYLLIFHTPMLTAGIGKIRFNDTLAEASRVFNQAGWEKKPKIPFVSVVVGLIRRRKNEKDATSIVDPNKSKAVNDHLMTVKTEIAPKEVKGDRSKSVLFDACRLAKELLKEDMKAKKWKIMNAVWTEMLCYAAGHCRGYYHAQRLSKGGELLTFVWFLMAHFGIGQQYRIEAGHARAKLIIVDK
ncbi:hypothetical protein QJS10_CPB15g01333 [Acorus calamus]|uniref:DUF4220 domain-containing protein n=1 Tax=Acorus calamus TaxID=4465 RepID=A0AAV9D5K6_ACOCL|nr:hypothetical protein QJS10_CPB15g01333 [Acorus calamus]